MKDSLMTIGVVLGWLLLLLAGATLFIWCQAQLLTWTFPHFGIHGVGMAGPVILSMFLDSFIFALIAGIKS